MGKIAKELLDADPEAIEQVQRYKAALLRVEAAQSAAKVLDTNYQAAMRTAVLADKQDEVLQRQKADDSLAAAEVSAAELRMLAAELSLSLAQKEQRAFSRSEERDADRVESAKAGAAAALGALVCYLPLAAANGGTLLSIALATGAVAASGLLFGVTYRYAVREDAENAHLKGGVVAAFGLVRAVAAADVMQAAAAAADSPGSMLDMAVLGPTALYAAQSMLVFGFAATGVEAAFNTGNLKRFKSAPPR